MQKYLQLMKISLINRLDYRQELATTLFVGFLVFTGQAVFWSAVFDGREVVNGFTFSQILVYYLLARITSDIIDSKVGFKLTEMILSGQVSSFLLKPITFQVWLLFQEISQMVTDALIKALIYILIFLMIFGGVDIAFINIPMFVISMGLSFLIGFSIFFLVGCIAFWTENARSLNYALGRIILFLAGGLVPLAFFPDFLQDVIKILPFAYMFDLPVKILTDKIEYNEIFMGMGIQIIWIILLWFFAKRVFSWFVKHNESVGI